MGIRLRLLAVVSALCIVAFGMGAAVGGASRARAAKNAVKLFTPSGKPLPGRWQSYADVALVPTVVGRVVVRRAPCPARPRAAAACTRRGRG